VQMKRGCCSLLQRCVGCCSSRVAVDVARVTDADEAKLFHSVATF